MTRHQKNEADGVRGREDAIGSATARGGENRAGRARFGRIGRPSSFRDGRDRGRAIESIDRRLRACRKTPPERARFGTAGTRVFYKMARGSTGPSPFRLAGRDAARLREPRRGLIERASGGWIHRTRRATNPDAARLVQIAPHRVAFDPIATCLVPRDRFSRRADQGARTHLLPSPACGREGLYKTRKTRRRTRVPFVGRARTGAAAVATTAVRRRFGERRSKLAFIFRVFDSTPRSRPSSRLRRPAHVDLKTDGRKQLCAARFFSNFTVRDSTFELGLSVRQFDQSQLFANSLVNRRFFCTGGRSIRVMHARRASCLAADARPKMVTAAARVFATPLARGGTPPARRVGSRRAGRATRCADRGRPAGAPLTRRRGDRSRWATWTSSASRVRRATPESRRVRHV